MQIVRALPKRLRLSDWAPIYSTYTHGITLSTLYSKVQQLEESGETVLVVRDNKGYVRAAGARARDPPPGTKSNGHACAHARPRAAGGWQIFGCFATQPWHQDPFYYGSGEMFMFQLHPVRKLYHWTGQNHFFQLGHHNCLAVGGRYDGGVHARRAHFFPCGRLARSPLPLTGAHHRVRPHAGSVKRARSGTFALWLDQQLYHGSSARCETFDNDVLAHSEDFLVMGLELWGFLPSI